MSPRTKSPGSGTFLTSAQAAKALEVSVSTLYAYVSRGLIRSEPVDTSSRARRYRRKDIEDLKSRREQRRDPRKAVAGALSWGSPVLDSAITLIDGGRLFYRGHDVADLAGRQTFEQVAQLIWLGDLAADETLFGQLTARLPAGWRQIRGRLRELHCLEVFQILLPVAACDDLSSYDLSTAGVARCGARIVELLSSVAAGWNQGRKGAPPTGGQGVAGTLQEAWVPRSRRAKRVLDAALIVCADHELNVSSFTARCVASAGSTPYDVVGAGLSAMRGTRHGGASERAEADLAGLWAGESSKHGAAGRRGRRSRLRADLGRRLRSGERIAGFGHPIYPGGDPRYPILLKELRTAAPDSPELEFTVQFAEEVGGLIGVAPNIDFGLATLSLVLGLTPGSAITLFALGRTVGWIGQAMEQIAEGRLIRPRARYVGPAVGGGS